MTEIFYQITRPERDQLLLQEGFVKDEERIWRHPDGRAIGDSIVTALTDDSFVRYLGAADTATEQVGENAKAGNE